ncbi:MAG: hypothetical protein JSR80_07270, partial [Verrucomicrobia bacterium]|nr:hypothetical protein [Verrucomicrobiota bacterium]
MRLILFLMALASSFSLSAYDLFKDRCWEIGVAFIYWKPFGEPYTY